MNEATSRRPHLSGLQSFPPDQPAFHIHLPFFFFETWPASMSCPVTVSCAYGSAFSVRLSRVMLGRSGKPSVMSQSTSTSTVDELVEQGYRSANNTVIRMFTRTLDRNPGADLWDILQMALRRYPSLRRQADERPQKRQRKGMHPLI